MIDLTSEPESPTVECDSLKDVEIQNSQYFKAMEEAYCDETPHREFTKSTFTNGSKVQALKLDMPLFVSSSDQENANGFADLAMIEGDFEETKEMGNSSEPSLASFLETRQTEARKITEHESFCATNSGLRLSIPHLDFEVPDLEWGCHLSSAKEQYDFILGSFPRMFEKDPRKIHSVGEGSLTWNPIPVNARHWPQPEELNFADSQSSIFLHATKMHGRGFDVDRLNGRFAVQDWRLFLEKMSCVTEMDVELLWTSPKTQKASLVESRRSPEAGENAMGRSKETDSGDNSEYCSAVGSMSSKSSHTLAIDSLVKGVDTVNEHAATIKLSRTTELAELTLPTKLPGNVDFRQRVLPIPGSVLDTGDLLATFMELRRQKRTCSAPATNAVQSWPSTAGNCLPMFSKRMPTTEATSASIFPEFSTPDEKAAFVVSVNLGRVVMRHLERHWPRELLIDRDFSCRRRSSWARESSRQDTQYWNDADLALTPKAGLVVTNMSAVLQKQLPGTSKQTLLRDKIEAVATKFEVLYILVSENNKAGELINPMTQSDMAAYKDLVHFTASLPSECMCLYSTGAEETVAKWILSLMCRHNAEALIYRPYLSPYESSWEVFLRRSGLSSAMAQVLASKLSWAGNAGLAQFLALPTQQKLAEFGPFLDCPKMLIGASQILDRRWS